MQQADQVPVVITPGTLMQKAVQPRLIEPYLASRRTVIAGYVYRVQDSSFTGPADYYEALGLGYDGSGFGAGISELYLMRWSAVSPEAYRVPYSAQRGGDFAGKPPFTGTGFTASVSHTVPEFYIEPMTVPVGAEIYLVTWDGEQFIARFDGQVWLRPPGVR